MKSSFGASLAALACFPLLAQQPERSFTARVEVTVRTVTAVLTDAEGRPLDVPPAPEQLEVREDGRACEVLGIEPALHEPAAPEASPAPPPAGPAQPAVEPAVRRHLRRQVLYVDADFLRTRSVKEVAGAFAAQADAVVAIGPIEIVVADPQPKTFLSPTRSAAELRAALARLAKKVPGRDRVVTVRRDAEETAGAQRGMGAWTGRARPVAVTGSGLSRMGAREEAILVEGGLARLARWATSSPREEEGILYLASDGFEVDVADFYRDASSTAIRTEVLPGLLSGIDGAEQALLAGGWTTVPVAVNAATNAGFTGGAEFSGHGHTADASGGAAPLSFGDHPFDGLRRFADATGGDVLVAGNQVAPEVSRLSRAWRVSFRVARVPDGRLHALAIRSTVPGVRVRSVRAIPVGTPASASTSRVLDLLEGDRSAAGALPVALAFSPVETHDGQRAATLQVKVATEGLAPLLDRVGRGRVRVSVAVEVPGQIPFVTHQESPLPRELPKVWLFDAPIRWPKEAKRIAVVAEELGTGTTGGASAELPAPR